MNDVYKGYVSRKTYEAINKYLENHKAPKGALIGEWINNDPYYTPHMSYKILDVINFLSIEHSICVSVIPNISGFLTCVWIGDKSVMEALDAGQLKHASYIEALDNGIKWVFKNILSN